MDPLIGLALSTFIFVGGHLAMSHPLRAPLVAALGERGFAGLYSLVAAASLVAMVVTWRQVPASVPLWIAPPALWWVASGLMLVACILLVGSLVRNPAFPHPGAPPTQIPAPRGVFAITRHPMNWSFMIWAAVHIMLMGSARNLIVAQAILLLALVGSIGQDAKKARLMGEVWRDYQARTSFVPFAALLAGRVGWRQAVPGVIALVGGFALWTLVTWSHAPLWSPLVLIGYYG